MRILQVVQKPQRRGAETFAYQLSAELRRSGDHDVCIVYLYPYRGDATLPLGPSDFCLQGDEGHFAERTLGFHPRLLGRLARRIDELEPDVVQVNGARTVKYGALCRALRSRSGWSLIYRNIGDPRRWVRGVPTRAFYRWIVAPRLDGVVGVSEATLEAVRDFYGRGLPTAQIPRAVDPSSLDPERPRNEVRRELGVATDAPVMVFVGSLTPEKRIDRLLRVLERVRHGEPGLRLWIVGAGPLRAELERQARSLGLGDAVRFLGARGDVGTWIAGADLLVLASDTEGLPGVILEAGWLRRPAVATNVGGVSECLVHEETGLLVEPDDEAAFAAAVERLIADPGERRAMGERARARVAERYTMERIAGQYVDFYRRVREG